MEQIEETPETTPDETELLFPYSIGVPHTSPAFLNREHYPATDADGETDDGGDLSTYYNLKTVGDARELHARCMADTGQIHQAGKIAGLCDQALLESGAMPESLEEE